MIPDHKLLATNMFSTLNEAEKNFIMEIVCFYHYRNGVKHEDGSMGTIEISPKEMNDVLAYCYKKEIM
ncbi:MAG: hypothetical protein WC346_04770 [Methanogenium sp.]|jgi:hypothetical protein